MLNRWLTATAGDNNNIMYISSHIPKYIFIFSILLCKNTCNEMDTKAAVCDTIFISIGGYLLSYRIVHNKNVNNGHIC